ncbi:YjjG family noncanonical pyrimidine nucleotidase [Formosa algae]|uniref:Hydrolase of the HAD superfamily n=1 Tax=Formosa algae TaxID=225843 RepID=A0A9X0YII2_9FLAO|nr:YjjG family noncanonical pyrimidine nucleotidase [Formosa algae]MBP1839020.1 putative hydrolase of the HAD superfamily [Formosa algae]MDQ0333797.1 putative hydrolase of the HAD superfamily [Formosa algae]OEI78979.1 noncanonical pyrimidine nucleotidase, YjjG family [Formosa algae]PNW29306.1 noncanonical pyrimidine nucleotidase, YjjG family [Formosa algae]
MTNNITDVFFDLDHTLWDFEKNSSLTFQKIFEVNQLDIDLNVFLDAYVPVNFNYWSRFRKGEVDKDTLRFGRLNDTFVQLKMPITSDLVYKLSDDYIAYLSSFNHLFDDTISILNYLQPKYNLHIITNGFEEVQNSKLAGSKINQYFKTVTNSEQAGVKKPHPDIFNFALQQANAEVNTSIMIGDNLEADILGAINVGLQAIYFNEIPLTTHQDITQIDKLIDLKTYL